MQWNSGPQPPFKDFPLNVFISWKGFFICRSRNLGCYYRCRWWTWGYPESINSTISLCSFIIYLTCALILFFAICSVSLRSCWRFLAAKPCYRFRRMGLQLFALKKCNRDSLLQEDDSNHIFRTKPGACLWGDKINRDGGWWGAGYQCNSSKENLVSGQWW